MVARRSNVRSGFSASVLAFLLSCMTIAHAGEPGGAADRKRLLILISETHYDTRTTLPPFAESELTNLDVQVLHGDADDPHAFTGLATALAESDGVLLSVRRITPPAAQLQALRQFIESGKPVMGIRTTSHAFSIHGEQPPAGRASWEAFDREVIGGNYHNHHSKREPPRITAASDAKSHPILTGVTLPFRSGGTLYKNDPLPAGSKPLLIGAIKNAKPEPVAWTFTHLGSGRTFYTSLGHVDDFTDPSFRTLLRNGIHWAMGLPIPEHD